MKNLLTATAVVMHGSMTVSVLLIVANVEDELSLWSRLRPKAR